MSHLQTENETHLEGALLEALAAGVARDDERLFAQRHLDACARCREELSAMRAENAGFTGFFAAEETELLKRMDANRPARSRKAYIFAAVAATAALIVCAASLSLLREQPQDRQNPRGTVAEENPGPKQPPVPQPVPTTTPTVPLQPTVLQPDPVPVPRPVEAPITTNVGEVATYQGSTAEEWVRILKTAKEEGAKEKARHALARIGAEALPLLLKMMREGTPAEKQDAGIVLAALEDKNSVPEIIKMLADPGWEVRLQAVRMLSKYVPTDDRVVQALQGALKDRDKAVAEAAEEALIPLKFKQAENQAKAAELLTMGKRELAAANWNAAAQYFQEALKLDPDSKDARVMLDMVAKQQMETKRQAEQISKLLDESQTLLKEGKYAASKDRLLRVLEVSPGNGQAQQMLARLKDLMAQEEDAKPKRLRSTVGESDLPAVQPAAPAPVTPQAPDKAQ